MTKWRAVLVGAMAAGALAAGSFIPADADPLVPTPIGELHVHGQSIKADGAPSNPDPLDGSLTISQSGVCTSDDAPTNPTNTCNEDIILNELP